MKKFKASLPVFPGFYGTYFEADEEPIIEDGKTWDDYEWDYPGYYESAGKACVNAVERQLNDLGFDLDIKFGSIYSPREYNFRNDAINAVYTLKSGCIGKIKDYLHTNLENFATFLKDTLKSYDGFISFYTYDVYEWLTFVNYKSFNRDEIYLEHVLNFILHNEGYDSEQLYYDAIDHGDMYLDGWLKEVEIEEDETEKDLGALWNYIPSFEATYNYIFNPNQLTLNI